MTRDLDAAFPIINGRSGYTEHKGLTKREYIATMALQGLVGQPLIGDIDKIFEHRAQVAVKFADALVTELNKG